MGLTTTAAGRTSLFGIADAGGGALAAALAAAFVAALTDDGLPALVLLRREHSEADGRCAAELRNHIAHLRGAALRSYLAVEGGWGVLLLDEAELGAPMCAALCDAYRCVLLAGDLDRLTQHAASLSRELPTLVVSDSAPESLAETEEALLRVRGGEHGLRPIAFALTEDGTALSSHLSCTWHLPSWGGLRDVDVLRERMKTCVAVAVLPSCDAPKKEERGCDSSDGDCSDEGGDGDAEDAAVQVVLRELRSHPELKESRTAIDLRTDAVLRRRVAVAARAIVQSSLPMIDDCDVRERIVSRALDEAIGAGPLEPLLADHDISEIMVNGCDRVFVERAGALRRTRVRFTSDAHLRTVIDRLLAEAGRRIDEAVPLADARLSDGSRIHAVLPPIAVDGPTVTIRRFLQRFQHLEDVVRVGMMDAATAGFLCACVRARLSIVVSGGTGAGKTTLLGLLAASVGPDERVITIEDAAELSLAASHVVRLEARPSNIEGRGAITIRDLVRNALRMRPDRIVVGECRGPEALDMLQAMNTGHEGSLTTVHANSPRDALARLETMVLMGSVELPLLAVRSQIARAVDMIVQVARCADGVRRVVGIAELTGLEGEIYTLQTLAERDAAGRWRPTGLLPRAGRTSVRAVFPRLEG